ncbi:unnamed protein product [Onchocerca flexuosa]|uniref:Uncharacterized protein n=1 Tax=Onchocerca flexuosa TaxID=387005 RepID=A0A183H3Q2_9BILA|nr:unnamed protein product [Onchocerca flexuosa]
MFHLVLIIVIFASKQCSGQLGYGGSGFCSSCSLGNSGSTSQGFGFGGGNYASSSNAANLGLAGQNLYSLLTNNGFTLPNNGDVYGMNGYGTGAGYGSTYSGSAPSYGIPATVCFYVGLISTFTVLCLLFRNMSIVNILLFNQVRSFKKIHLFFLKDKFLNTQIFQMFWNNAYGSTGNYASGNGYNCNSCLPNTGVNAVPVSTGYGASVSNPVYSSYSSLPDANYKTYSLPSNYGAFNNLGLIPSAYTSNSHSGLETSHSLPITYSSYPGYGSQNGINTLSNLFNYQRTRKAVAANDDSGIGKSSLSTSASS